MILILSFLEISSTFLKIIFKGFLTIFRRWLKKILDGNFSSCIEVYSKKGTTRANHYHKKDKHFIYVITGEILYFYKDRKKGSKVQTKKMKKNETEGNYD